MRVIDFLTDAATKPVMLPNAQAANKDALPTDAVLPDPSKPQADPQKKGG
jgi:hypothetical protein